LYRFLLNVRDKSHPGSRRRTLSKQLAVDTRHLQHGWSERFAEAGSVEQVKSRSRASRQHDNRFVPAAPRLGDLVAMLSGGFARLGDLRFDQRNFGIATERTDVSLYAFGARETSVKERHSIHAMLSNAQIA
jgi:hypothetical protein